MRCVTLRACVSHMPLPLSAPCHWYQSLGFDLLAVCTEGRRIQQPWPPRLDLQTRQTPAAPCGPPPAALRHVASVCSLSSAIPAGVAASVDRLSAAAHTAHLQNTIAAIFDAAARQVRCQVAIWLGLVCCREHTAKDSRQSGRVSSPKPLGIACQERRHRRCRIFALPSLRGGGALTPERARWCGVQTWWLVRTVLFVGAHSAHVLKHRSER